MVVCVYIMCMAVCVCVSGVYDDVFVCTVVND